MAANPDTLPNGPHQRDAANRRQVPRQTRSRVTDRRLDAPGRYVHVQVARLLDRYHGVGAMSAPFEPAPAPPLPSSTVRSTAEAATDSERLFVEDHEVEAGEIIGEPSLAAGAGALVASGGTWFAPRRYQALAAANMASAAIPSASSASIERFFGWAGFATAGAPTSSE